MGSNEGNIIQATSNDQPFRKYLNSYSFEPFPIGRYMTSSLHSSPLSHSEPSRGQDLCDPSNKGANIEDKPESPSILRKDPGLHVGEVGKLSDSSPRWSLLGLITRVNMKRAFSMYQCVSMHHGLRYTKEIFSKTPAFVFSAMDPLWTSDL